MFNYLKNITLCLILCFPSAIFAQPEDYVGGWGIAFLSVLTLFCLILCVYTSYDALLTILVAYKENNFSTQHQDHRRRLTQHEKAHPQHPHIEVRHPPALIQRVNEESVIPIPPAHPPPQSTAIVTARARAPGMVLAAPLPTHFLHSQPYDPEQPPLESPSSAPTF